MARNFAAGNYLEIASNSVFDSSTGTIAFWLKTTQTTGNTVLLSRWSGSSRNGIGFLMNNTANKLDVIEYDASTGRNPNLTSLTSINTGAWVHIAMVYDRTTTANGNKLYINGTLEKQGASSAAWSPSGNPIRVGKTQDNFWGQFVGDQTDVCWWDAQLTADEVMALASRCSPRRVRPGNLQLHLPLAA